MSMYGGLEQVGPIGQSIISHDVQTSTDYGDIGRSRLYAEGFKGINREQKKRDCRCL